jgi:maltose O-acetyltransferase
LRRIPRTFPNRDNRAARLLAKRLLGRIRRDVDLDRSQRRGARIGKNVDVGRDVYLADLCPWLLTIGDDVTIGMHVTIFTHDNSSKLLVDYTQVSNVTIEDRVYIGAFSIILPGVTIGEGSVIGAGSVIRNDIPAGVVAAGSPARVLGDCDSFVSKHRRGLERGPVYEDVWAGGRFDVDAVPSEMRERMRSELQDGRRGYIP